jgi:acyl-CoA reductase-like NAD-dependent aldehyde dehydrogenase
MPPHPVEVTQEDREAAAILLDIAGWRGVAVRLRTGVDFPEGSPEGQFVSAVASLRQSPDPVSGDGRNRTQILGGIADEYEKDNSDFAFDKALEAAFHAGRSTELTRNAALLKEAREALSEIANPLAAMQRRAAEEGASLDGRMATMIANDVNHARKIARQFLDKGGSQ